MNMNDSIDESFRAGIPNLESARAKVDIANSNSLAAYSPTIQWDVTRELPQTLQERSDALEEIRSRHNATCPLCLAARQQDIVFGQGSAHAELVFVSDAPGDNEAAVGTPFQGDSGAKLDEMIKAMGLSREQVCLTYVVKCPLQEQHPATQEQLDQCASFLVEQLLVIRPKVIVPLGGPAAKHLLRSGEGISLLRGKWGFWTPPHGCQVAPIPVMPTFHPAYLLRNYTVETRAFMWSDLKLAMTKLSAT
jgi:DNA polymerase